MRTVFFALFFAIGILSALCPAFGADYVSGIRCPSGKLISVGDSKLEVISKCGQPARKDTAKRETYGRDGIPVVTVDRQWTYNFGPTDFVYILDFYGARLKSIRQGDRGF